MTPSLWLAAGLGAALGGAWMSSMQGSLRTATRIAIEQHDRKMRERRANDSNGAASSDLDRTPAAIIAGDLAGHAAAVAAPRVLFNTIAAIAMVMWVAGVRSEAPMPDTEAATTSVRIGIDLIDMGVGAAVAAAAIWLLSIVLPIAIADHAGARTVVAFAWLIRGLHILLTPLRAIVGLVSEVVRRLSGEAAKTEAQAREEELLELVEESERVGGLDEDAREMIEAVVEFRSTTVESIMSPRTDIEAFEYTDDLDVVKKFAKENHHSRLPVYGENLDDIKGLLYVKDLLRWLVAHEGEKTFKLQEILRPATFVPETKTVKELLHELLAEKVHIAFAIDEYGGTSGLVTIEDIVEEVFGEIRDEYEIDEEPDPGVSVDQAKGHAEVDARAEIDDANDELESLGLELPESEHWDTVGGFVVTTLGRIPANGETFRHNGSMVTILEAEPTRVVRIRIEPAQDETEQSKDAEEPVNLD